MHFWGIQSLKGASSFVTFGWMIKCDKRTENHNLTITTNTSQHVEFFHSLIFNDLLSFGKNPQIISQSWVLILILLNANRKFYSSTENFTRKQRFFLKYEIVKQVQQMSVTTGIFQTVIQLPQFYMKSFILLHQPPMRTLQFSSQLSLQDIHII